MTVIIKRNHSKGKSHVIHILPWPDAPLPRIGEAIEINNGGEYLVTGVSHSITVARFLRSEKVKVFLFVDSLPEAAHDN